MSKKLLVVLIASSVFMTGCTLSTSQSRPKGCTKELRICPDGTGVGRTGPNCEFAPCPSTTPVVTPSSSPTPEQANIIISEPKLNQTLSFPFVVKGQARVFENVLSLALLDENQKVVSEMVTTANSPDVGQFGQYVVEFKTKPSSKSGFVKAFSHSAKDGIEINVVLIPVRFE